MKRTGRRVTIGVGATYCVLWLMTATWGISDVDKAIDSQFRMGSTQMPPLDGTVVPEFQSQRIETMADVTNLRNPNNLLPDDSGLFRYRSTGIAVAPFLIVDEAAVVWAPLRGFGGQRLSFWCFGSTRWALVNAYWHV